jgi:hypothetical protein
MSPQVTRLVRWHAVVYLSLAATGAVIGWNRSKARPGPAWRG